MYYIDDSDKKRSRVLYSVSLGMMCLVPFSSNFFIRMILTIEIMVLFFNALCISIKMIKQFFHNY